MKKIKIMSGRSWKYYVGLSFVLLFSLLITSFFAIYGEMDPHHDGFIFKTSLDVSRGEVLFKETFTQYGAFIFYLNAILIRVFGESVLVIRALTCIMYTAIFGILYIICMRYFNTFYSVSICLISLFMAHFYFTAFFAWSSVYALCFLLISAYSVILFSYSQQLKWIFICAITTMVTFWLRQPVGIVSFFAFYCIMLFFSLTKENIKQIMKASILFALTYVFLNGIMIFYLLLTGSLKDWWFQSVIGMIEFGTDVGTNNGNITFFKKLFDCLFPMNQSIVWIVLPVSCILYLFFFLLKTIKNLKNNVKTSAEQKEIFVLTVYALASWHQYFPVNDQLHMYWSAVPMFIILAYIINRTLKRLVREKRLFIEFASVLVLVLIFSKGLYFRLAEGYYKLTQPFQIVDCETYPYLKGIRLSEKVAHFYNELFEIVESLKEHHGEIEVINTTSEAFYSCFSMKNITPKFFGDNSYYKSKEKREEFIKKNSPIVIGYEGTQPNDYHLVKTIEGFNGNLYGAKNNISVYAPDKIIKLQDIAEEVEKNPGTQGIIYSKLKNVSGNIYMGISNNGHYLSILNKEDTNQFIKVILKEDLYKKIKSDTLKWQGNSLNWYKSGECWETVENFVLFPGAGVEILIKDNIIDNNNILSDINVRIIKQDRPITFSTLESTNEYDVVEVQNFSNGSFYLYYFDALNAENTIEIMYPYEKNIVKSKKGKAIKYREKKNL